MKAPCKFALYAAMLAAASFDHDHYHVRDRVPGPAVHVPIQRGTDTSTATGMR
jgi:hypothetical protein